MYVLALAFSRSSTSLETSRTPPFAGAGQELTEWMATSGIRMPDQLQLRRSRDHGWYVRATAALKPEELVISVPANMLISPHGLPLCAATALGGDGCTSTLCATDVERVALALLRERERGSKSAWAPYLKALPRVQGSLAGTLPARAETLLRGTYTQSIWSKLQPDVARLLRYGAALVSHPGGCMLKAEPTRAEALWALRQVRSRAFTVDQKKKTKDQQHVLHARPFLAPGADFFNHHPLADMGWKIGQEEDQDRKTAAEQVDESKEQQQQEEVEEEEEEEVENEQEEEEEEEEEQEDEVKPVMATKGKGSRQGIDASSFRMYVINGVMPPISDARDSDDAGEVEVFNHYQTLSNAELFATFGFAVENNADDFIGIALAVSDTDPRASAKRAMLMRAGITDMEGKRVGLRWQPTEIALAQKQKMWRAGETIDSCAHKLLTNARAVEPALLQLARVVLMPEKFVDRCSRSQIAKLGEGASPFDSASAFGVSDDLDKQVLRQLGAGLSALGSGMAGGTVADDRMQLHFLERELEVKLSASGDVLNPIQLEASTARFALMCRLGEKQLIETAMRELNHARGIAPNGQLLQDDTKTEL